MLTRGLLVIAMAVTTCSIASADEPVAAWSPVIIPTGVYRQHIQSLPIPQRPGRPLHVYGNTVRLIHQSRHSGHLDRPLQQIFLGTGWGRRYQVGVATQ